MRVCKFSALSVKGFDMKQVVCAALVIVGFGFTGSAVATGLATCNSGPKSGWQPVEKLEQALKEKGYTIRRIREDGGCYEVYALNEKGERGEYYFHPVTLQAVPTKAR
jgi:hypothetical protein